MALEQTGTGSHENEGARLARSFVAFEFVLKRGAYTGLGEVLTQGRRVAVAGGD